MKGSVPCLIGIAIALIDLEVQHIAQQQREDDAVTVNACAAEHASRRDGTEASQLVSQELEEILADSHIAHVSRFAERIGADALTPH
jgi:hypothetical protein